MSETDPARVDVLSVSYEEEEYQRRTRRGGQNQRDAVAQQNREGHKRLLVLVGEVDALDKVFIDATQVPRAAGLQSGETSCKPLEKGTSFFTTGYFDEIELPDQIECPDETEV